MGCISTKKTLPIQETENLDSNLEFPIEENSYMGNKGNYEFDENYDGEGNKENMKMEFEMKNT